LQIFLVEKGQKNSGARRFSAPGDTNPSDATVYTQGLQPAYLGQVLRKNGKGIVLPGSISSSSISSSSRLSDWCGP